MSETPSRALMPRGRIYLDNNATTLILRQSLEAVVEATGKVWGNPSGQYAEGMAAHAALESARKTFSDLMGVPADTIYFTSGGTESNNIVLRGIMSACGRIDPRRDTVVTSSVEHSSILKTADLCGSKHVMVPVDNKGYVNIDAFRRILQSNARKIGLVSIILAQNEVGTLQKIPLLVRITREVLGTSVPFHTDATQALGKYVVRPEDLGVDMLTGSAHKFHGPRGVGILYARSGTLKPGSTPMTGGGQEMGCRAGTENVPAIIGAAVAFRHAVGNVNRLEQRRARIKTMRDFMLATLERNVPGLVINGDPQRGLYNTLSVSFPNGHAHAMCSYLNQRGISIGAGSACHKGKVSTSLMSILGSDAIAEKVAHGTVRISLSHMNTPSQCQTAAEEIVRAWRVTNELAAASAIKE